MANVIQEVRLDPLSPQKRRSKRRRRWFRTRIWHRQPISCPLPLMKPSCPHLPARGMTWINFRTFLRGWRTRWTFYWRKYQNHSIIYLISYRPQPPPELLYQWMMQSWYWKNRFGRPWEQFHLCAKGLTKKYYVSAKGTEFLFSHPAPVSLVVDAENEQVGGNIPKPHHTIETGRD